MYAYVRSQEGLGRQPDETAGLLLRRAIRERGEVTICVSEVPFDPAAVALAATRPRGRGGMLSDADGDIVAFAREKLGYVIEEWQVQFLTWAKRRDDGLGVATEEDAVGENAAA